MGRSVVSMTLSEEEYNRHRATFTALDVNKDGTITLAEMQKVLLSKGIECKTEDLIKLMDSADKDRNSSISWQEYLSLVIKLNQKTQKMIKDRQEDELRQYFSLVDTDGDGIISFVEFTKLFEEMKDLEQDPTKLRELFDTTDSNKDGAISFEEFRKLLE